MYSVVMMMALTAGGETPAFGGRGCHGCSGGCYGGYSCGGCSGGGCHGGRGGLFGRRHGCHGCCGGGYSCGGCYGGGYGCSGSGCWGGGYGGCYGGGYGCSGGGCWGGYGGCYGGGGCWGGGYAAPGGMMMQPSTGTGTGTGTKGGEGKGEELGRATQAPATIVVSLPADARLTIDDRPTTSKSELRTFVSPALPVGNDYSYTLKAEIVRDGQTLTATKQVSVRAGQESRVALEFPASRVASR
jgi:uncharacterized protein (TIGR03000 family)